MGEWLLYNVMLIAAVEQSGSPRHTHPLPWALLPRQVWAEFPEQVLASSPVHMQYQCCVGVKPSLPVPPPAQALLREVGYSEGADHEPGALPRRIYSPQQSCWQSTLIRLVLQMLSSSLTKLDWFLTLARQFGSWGCWLWDLGKCPQSLQQGLLCVRLLGELKKAGTEKLSRFSIVTQRVTFIKSTCMY